MMPRNRRNLSNQFRRSRPFRRRGRRLSLAPRSLSALLILALLIPALLAGCAGVTETADAPAATAAPEVTAAPSPSPEAADSAPAEADLLYTPIRNEYGGRVSVEAQVTALRPGGS